MDHCVEVIISAYCGGCTCKLCGLARRLCFPVCVMYFAVDLTQSNLYSDHLWVAKSGRSREVVSLQRSESIVLALLGHDQVIFIERWSFDTSGL